MKGGDTRRTQTAKGGSAGSTQTAKGGSTGPTQAARGGYTRLTQPLVRENGVLRPATWDEALDKAARGFRAVTGRHGGRSFGLFSCSKATNEVNYLAQKFARAVIGSNNVDSCNRT